MFRITAMALQAAEAVAEGRITTIIQVVVAAGPGVEEADVAGVGAEEGGAAVVDSQRRRLIAH